MIRIDINLLRKLLHEIANSIFHINCINNKNNESFNKEYKKIEEKISKLENKIELIIREVMTLPTTDKNLIIVKRVQVKDENTDLVVIECDKHNRDGLVMLRYKVIQILNKLMEFYEDVKRLVQKIGNINKNVMRFLEIIINKLKDALSEIENRLGEPLIKENDVKKIVTINI